ncbi:MAG: HEAT repeat domain-containing protein [Proteobacteria bacterium]|nr:HEAT repeat domain-containing protein [Pseudomonadota bacterium]
MKHKRISQVWGAAVLLALVGAWTTPLWADETVAVTAASHAGDAAAEISHGARVGDIQHAVERGHLVARQGKQSLWRAALPEMAAGAATEIAAVPLGPRHIAVRIDMRPTGGRSEARVFVWQRGAKTAREVWSGITSATGDVGEETADVAQFVGPREDGTFGLMTGLRAAGIPLCGQAGSPLLYRRLYDVRTQRFTPWNGPRDVGEVAHEILGVALSPVADQNTDNAADETAGETGDKANNKGADTPMFLVPRAVSSSPGDGEMPMLHTQPTGLLDAQQLTGWVPAWGDGGGEFVTVQNRAAHWGIAAVRVTVGMPQSGDARAVHPAPASVLLLSESERFRLRFPAGASSGTWEFALPAPLQARCLSLVMEEVPAPAGRKALPAALLTLQLVTDLDSPDLLSHLAAMLGDVDAGESAAALLADYGAEIYAPIRRAFSDLNRSGQRRAIRLLADRAPASGVEMLAQAALVKDPAISQPALAGLRRVVPAAVRALNTLAAAKKWRVAEGALKVLAQLDGEAPFAALLQHVGALPAKRRVAVRNLALQALQRDPQRAQRLLAAVDEAMTPPYTHRTWDLLYLAVRQEATRAQAAAHIETIYAQAAQFDDAYRAMRLAALAGDAALSVLRSGAAHEDAHVQEMALRGLGPLMSRDRESELSSAVLPHLKAPQPALRIAALSALSAAQGRAAEATLKAILRDDPWPEVRHLAVPFVAHFAAEGARFAVLALQDPSLTVREAALAVAKNVPDASVGEALVALLNDGDENLELRGAAALVLAARCEHSDAAVQAMGALLERGAEPLAVAKEQLAASQAALALAQLGTPKARKVLGQVRTRSNPAVSKAIDDALKTASKCPLVRGDSGVQSGE